MKNSAVQVATKVLVSPEWWDSLQTNLQDAVTRCNDITGRIEAHQRFGRHSAELLLDEIGGQVREVRKLIEGMVTPI